MQMSGGTKWQPLRSGEELFIRYFDASGTRGTTSGAGGRGSGTQTNKAGSGGMPALYGSGSGATEGGGQGPVQMDALLCWLSHGHVFPELWK